MSKCAICHTQPIDMTWQPCGPDQSPACFVTPGSHYRGFPAIGVCAACKTRIEAALTQDTAPDVAFVYKGQPYMATITGIVASPF
jgi:hypothetical protein